VEERGVQRVRFKCVRGGTYYSKTAITKGEKALLLLLSLSLCCCCVCLLHCVTGESPLLLPHMLFLQNHFGFPPKKKKKIFGNFFLFKN